jgi:hypothetical protein
VSDRGKEILKGLRDAPTKGMDDRLRSLLGRPHSACRVIKGKRICLMRNECLACDGSCVGYGKTAKRMASRREAYRERQAALRRRKKQAK